jgi:hypothetical protein
VFVNRLLLCVVSEASIACRAYAPGRRRATKRAPTPIAMTGGEGERHELTTDLLQNVLMFHALRWIVRGRQAPGDRVPALRLLGAKNRNRPDLAPLRRGGCAPRPSSNA